MVFDARDLHAVQTVAEFHTKQAQFLRQHTPHRKPFTSQHRPAVYLNHGNWLIDCPHCGNAPAVLDTVADCFQCGARFVNLERPSRETDIVTIVSQRRRGARNFRPDRDTVNDLIFENAAAGDRFAVADLERL